MELTLFWTVADYRAGAALHCRYLAKAQGLPKQVFEDEDMKRLWTLTNTNVSL